jgi:hypothetical protein
MKYSPPLQAVQISKMCGDGGLIEVANKAIKQGITLFKSDVATIINDQYKPAAKRFAGALGQIHKAKNYKIFTNGGAKELKLQV